MKRRRYRVFFLTAIVSLAFSITIAASGSLQSGPVQEEEEDYYQKWLSEDALYIIMPEERDVLENLTTDEEKARFIEQFWYRRDADPRTSINEFKEEHYRRIAYANQWFKSGKPGWRTDRGRIYIMHGPPDEIESHPAGGQYQRPTYQGGGFTSTYPFEIWRYRHIEGVGQEVELEFVDPVGGGEYRLALNPEEKDALLHVPGVGLTSAEQRGLASKADRPYFSGSSRALMNAARTQDLPFDRYEIYSRIQVAPEIKYKDLKEIVNINIAYDNLPFKIRQDYFKLNDQQVLVPITLEIENKNLTYEQEAGRHVARVAVYGIITSITNRIITEFEDELVSAYQTQSLQAGLLARSLYQKIVPLEARMRYKIDLVVKDVISGKVGLIRQAIVPPAYSQNDLSASSLVLSNYIRQLTEIPKANQMFVLGDIWIHPALDNTFLAGSPVGVYLQLYNVGLDQASLAPSVALRYTISRGGEKLAEIADEKGESVLYYSGRRLVLVKALPVTQLEPGQYRLEVSVQDQVKNQELTVADSFQILAASQQARQP